MVKTVARNRYNTWREPKPGRKANRPQVLERLIGLETEYGLLRDQDGSQLDVGKLFDSIRIWFAAKTSIAPSLYDEKRFFTANGGCIGIEPSQTGDVDQGMVEGATPECRSPLQLVTYQSAQDQMLAECLFDIDAQRSMAWIKNSGDAFGHVYGQHENYELQIATGWRLFAWRLGLLLLLPLLVVYKMFASCWLLFVATLDRLGRFFVKRDPLEKLLEQKPREWWGHESQSLSPRMVRLAAAGLRYLHWPIALLLHSLIATFVLIPHRRWMAGFFVSRPVIDGSGHLDRQGRFWLSSRAASTNAFVGFGRYWNERPIFGMGHWLRSILICRSPSFAAWRRLFAQRQRVQVTLGDATPNLRTQHFRIGATCLVFDLIESRQTDGLPRFANCLADMKSLMTDQSMLRTIRDRQGRSWSAIELQRHYASAVRHFLSLYPTDSKEAMEIVEQWQLTLDHLQESEHDADCQRWLLGRVDWFSKRWLIDQTAHSASWSAQKKIDIKYHELSKQGYYHMMVQSLAIAPLASHDQMKRSMRLPPSDTPATARGYWIREFSDESANLKVDWQSIHWVDEFGNKKHVKLS